MLYVSYSIDQLQEPLKTQPAKVKTKDHFNTYYYHHNHQSSINNVLEDMWSTFLVFSG